MLALCLGIAALAALTCAVLVAGGGLPAFGTARTTGATASSPTPTAASVAALERSARVEARRLGLRAPARTPLPRSAAALVRRSAQLTNVVAFLKERHELAPSIARPSVASSAAVPAPLRSTFQRAARASLRLGISQPARPRLVDAPNALAAQTERWRDVNTWLARAGEVERPAEIDASAAAVAMDYRGTPYVYGGSSPSGFDCSGLVSYAYAQVGRSVPHNTNAIWGAFAKVPRNELRLGDMVFFSGLGHVGMYVGHGRFVHSPHTGDVVRVELLASRDDYVGAVRV